MQRMARIARFLRSAGGFGPHTGIATVVVVAAAVLAVIAALRGPAAPRPTLALVQPMISAGLRTDSGTEIDAEIGGRGAPVRPPTAEQPGLIARPAESPRPAADHPSAETNIAAGGNFRPNRPPLTPASKRWESGRLAIVIDDLGHNLAMPRRFLRLGLPLTYSILPDRPYSAEVAQLVSAAGRDYLIHVPMEPLDYPHANPGEDALLLKLDAAATSERLDHYLNALPGAIGVNNHMGSAYSFDAPKMAIVMESVARRGLFFLNSKTSASMVPAAIAREQGYAYLERDIFLDHVVEEAAIRSALEQALNRARVAGFAIAIGHPHPKTLRVLRQRFRGGRASGVRLVSLAEF